MACSGGMAVIRRKNNAGRLKRSRRPFVSYLAGPFFRASPTFLNVSDSTSCHPTDFHSNSKCLYLDLLLLSRKL